MTIFQTAAGRSPPGRAMAGYAATFAGVTCGGRHPCPPVIDTARTAPLQPLMCCHWVNKVASKVDAMEQSVHKLVSEIFDVFFVSRCFNKKIYNMASLACIVQSPYSGREFNRFICVSALRAWARLAIH